MNVNELIEGLHPLERKVLPYLSNCKSLKEIQEKSKLQEIEVSRALQWLENKNIVNVKKNNFELIQIGKNGKVYLEKGLPEKQFLKAIKTKNLTLNKISDKTGLSRQELNISLGLLKGKKAIIFGKEIEITAAGKNLLESKSLEEKLLEKLPIDKASLSEVEKKLLKDLLKRKELVEVTIKKDKLVEITAIGKKLSKVKLTGNFIESLTPAIIRDGSWKDKKFRRYDVEINVPKIYPGKRHFINESKNYAKKIWLSMGFREMTGPVINSAFWNFDSLFVPQDHPAREMQDTFFLKGKSKLPEKKLVDAVKKQHEEVWGYKWNPEMAKKTVLRTHTTVLSARTIASLKESDFPVKYFSIGRNYRNEALDWSHLFEFNQSEGIVVDPKANFKQLLGYLKEFFKKMGYDEVRFRPAYFPYTEPSVEIDVHSKEKNKWIELGGAGILRPEVVKPLLGKDIPVLAWGFGLGRVILPYYEIKDLRDFYKNDLKQLKEMNSWI